MINIIPPLQKKLNVIGETYENLSQGWQEKQYIMFLKLFVKLKYTKLVDLNKIYLIFIFFMFNRIWWYSTPNFFNY